jgi:DNA repair exonuclease SbcCD ATPase subunit
VTEIEAQNDELSGLLKELDEIAALDEQPVEDARRLLASGGGLSRRSYAGRGPLELEALIPELKRRSDYWHSANAAIHAMQDFHPLIETFQEAAYQRDQAHRALSEAESGVGRQRAWPPTTVSLDGERQELGKIEAQWQDLQNNHAKAIARTAQLGSLASRYAALNERIAQAVERAGRESSDVENLEADLDDLVQLWKNHLYELQEYPEAAADLQTLLEDISRELAQVRRRYQQGGMDYNAVLQSMKTLNRRVRYFQIALDDERALDIQGKVQVRREGKNVRGKF